MQRLPLRFLGQRYVNRLSVSQRLLDGLQISPSRHVVGGHRVMYPNNSGSGSLNCSGFNGDLKPGHKYEDVGKITRVWRLASNMPISLSSLWFDYTANPCFF